MILHAKTNMSRHSNWDELFQRERYVWDKRRKRRGKGAIPNVCVYVKILID
jgi:hypothetical protein